jgi:hypothetical protein
MYREISDLSLFVQTSLYGLGLYRKDLGQKYFSVQTSRSVNIKKFLIKRQFFSMTRTYLQWKVFKTYNLFGVPLKITLF